MAGLKKIIVASIITLVKSSFYFPIKANPINYPKAIKPLLRSPLPNRLRVLSKKVIKSNDKFLITSTAQQMHFQMRKLVVCQTVGPLQISIKNL